MKISLLPCFTLILPLLPLRLLPQARHPQCGGGSNGLTSEISGFGDPPYREPNALNKEDRYETQLQDISLPRLALSTDVCCEPYGVGKIEDLLHGRVSGSEIFGGWISMGQTRSWSSKSPVPMDDPKLSPDGKQILFALPPWRKGELTVINLDGSGLRKLLAAPPRPINTDAEWSPAGKSIVYQAYHPDLRPSTQSSVTDAQGLNSFQIAVFIEANMYFPFWLSGQQAHWLYGR